MKMKLLNAFLVSSLFFSPAFAASNKTTPPPDKYNCLKHMTDRLEAFTLTLSSCKLVDDDMAEVADFLHKHPGVLELIMDYNPDITATGLTTLLPETGNLVTLSMINDFGVGDSGAAVIGQMTTLTKLFVHNTNITATGAASIANLTGLNLLDISFNDIQDAGAASLSSLPAIVDLNVDSNNISSTGATSLAALTTLTRLVISNNFIGDAGATALVRTAPGSFWGQLNLNSNHVGDTGAAALATNRNFIELRLEDNDITDTGATSLSNNVDINGINFLDLAYNRIGPTGIAALNAAKVAGRVKNFFVFGNIFPLSKNAKSASFSSSKAEFKTFCAKPENFKICRLMTH